MLMFAACTMALALGSAESDPPLIPRPLALERRAGTFHLVRKGPLVVPAGEEELGGILGAALDLEVVAGGGGAPAGAVTLELAPALAGLGPEGYQLEVRPGAAAIRAPARAGLFYGGQTLVQLASLAGARSGAGVELPALVIRDRPRFRWRGLMLDCSRTFQSPAYLRKTIERMALYKLNVLHLHLCDDQGWRLEIRRYPELTRRGARFPPRYAEPPGHQGFYTQEEMRALIAYARARGITIVPEIEMPGHALAALSCYPQLSCSGGPFEIYPFFKGPGITKDVYCAGNEETFTFLEQVLEEVIAIFPAPFVHIGGDEVPKERWKACPRCQARIAAEGLSGERELQSWFIRRIEAFLHERGRRIIGWDEILEGGLAPRASVMSWRGIRGGVAAARAGHDVVMSPTSHCYFDYSYERIDTRRAYAFEPVPPPLRGKLAARVLGLQANFWSHIDREPALVDRQLFPRLLAIAERGWSPAKVRDWNSFQARLGAHLTLLQRLGIAYQREPRSFLLGTWSPAELSTSYRVLEWDASGRIAGPGSYRVKLCYRHGAHRLGIEWVELLAGDRSTARDTHYGFSGASDRKNSYTLELTRRDAGAVRWLVRASVRGEGGSDSHGEVILIASEKQR